LQIAQLLGFNELLPFIPLPKNVTTIDDCDKNGWRYICAHWGWFYMPTR
jgi:hypothetical protein